MMHPCQGRYRWTWVRRITLYPWKDKNTHMVIVKTQIGNLMCFVEPCHCVWPSVTSNTNFSYWTFLYMSALIQFTRRQFATTSWHGPSTKSAHFWSRLEYHPSDSCPFQTDPHCSRISTVSVAINHRLSLDHTKIVSLSGDLVLAVRFGPVTSLPGNTRRRKFTSCPETDISRTQRLSGLLNYPPQSIYHFYRASTHWRAILI